MTRLSKHISRKNTPQTERFSPEQVKNNAGGYVYKLDNWKILNRFLILGTEGGTYYVKEKKLTKDAARCVETCLKEDFKRTVDMIVEVSDAGRAVKNDPAIMALAISAADPRPVVRDYALAKLQKVCRIPTHLFTFIEFYEELCGWNTKLRKAVSHWYQDRQPGKAAYQLIKYQSRNGWSNRDVLRLAHPKPKNTFFGDLFAYVVKGKEASKIFGYPEAKQIVGFELAKGLALPSPKIVVDHELSWEMVPTEWLNSPEIWEALLPNMPLEAIIRNLGKMTSIGFISQGSEASKLIVNKLNDSEQINKARLHPLKALIAMKVYGGGHGFKGSLSWTPVSKIVDALDEAFYLGFGTITPTGKNILFALDISGSMSSHISLNMPISCAEGTAVLAMVQMRVEPNYEIMGFSHQFKHLDITPKMRLDQVMKKITRLNFGNTDCGLPFKWARENGLKFDGVVTLTDNETWYGNTQPVQEIKKYRDAHSPKCKSIVVGMTSTGFTINDPKDPFGLDVVGFDTATPQAISEFIRE